MIRHERRAPGKQWAANAPEIPWIAMDQRKPTPDDADIFGCILVCHQHNGVMVMGVESALSNSFVMGWVHTPRPMPEEGDSE